MVETNPRVLFLGPFPPPYGGIANHTRLLYESELAQRFHLSRLNISLPGEQTENVSQKNRASMGKGWRGMRALISKLRQERPDLVYVKVNGDRSCFRELGYMAVIRLLSHAKVVMHFHGMFKSYRRNFPFVEGRQHRVLNRVVINTLFALPHRSIFLSPMLREAFAPILTPGNLAKSTAVEHFVDLSAFEGPRPGGDGRVHVLFVGRLSREKGFLEVLEAIPRVTRAFPNTVFDVCGAPESPEALSEFRERMKRLEAEGVLRLHGLVSGKEKQEMFARADVLLFPTHNEVFPNVVLEGLAQGLPVVTTRVGVIPSIIEEGINGRFVEVGNAGSVSAVMIEILGDAGVRSAMSEANRAKAHNRFDKGIAVGRLTEIFHDVLRG